MNGILLAISTLTASLACAALPLLDAAPTSFDMSGLFESIVSKLGPYGCIIWYAWYTTAKTLPKKDETHAIERKQLLDMMTERQDKLITTLGIKIEQNSADIEGLRSTFWTKSACPQKSSESGIGSIHT